jgi:hypothetical protein
MRVIGLVVLLFDASVLAIRGSTDEGAGLATILVMVLRLVRVRPTVRSRGPGRRESGDEADQQRETASDARAMHTVLECSPALRGR